MVIKVNLFFMIIATIGINAAFSADWPMWRYDAGRTAAGPEKLPEQLEHLWTRVESPRKPVWDDPLNQDLMQYDKVFEPIVLGNTLFVGFNDLDKVAAFDTDTGVEKWSYYVDGPVRLPLAGWQNKIYFTSDDGYVYCLSADKGELLWKFRGGPSDRKIIGNERLISTWPARGGVVLYEGKLYFAASIWPFMGTFIYALDAKTGKIIWQNEGTGADYINQPHNSPSFAGIAPQGPFVLSGDKLLIPGGRSIPGCFDKKTGDMLYFHLAKHNKSTGAFTCANETYFFNHNRDRETNLYQISDGELVGRSLGKYPVMSKDVFYMSGDSILVRDVNNPNNISAVIKVDAQNDLIQAGDNLYAAGNGKITCVNVGGGADSPKIVWIKNAANVARLIAADGKLFAVTLDGKILAFGAAATQPQNYYTKNTFWTPSSSIRAKAQEILDQTGVIEGYALFYGVDDGDLLAALAQQSRLNFIAVDPDEKKISKLRRRFEELGLLGLRISFLRGTAHSFTAPQYMASLIVVNNSKENTIILNSGLVEHLYPALRPYGGKLWIEADNKQQNSLLEILENIEQATHTSEIKSLIVSRDGPLPGSASWTHQYGNISNTVKSDDELVKMPLGVLWFGGSSNMDVLPRHGHGPPEQVVEGRLIIQGMDCLNARDVYTGRVLWQTKLKNPEIYLTYFNETYADTPLNPSYNQEHIPGANSRGTNFIATSDWIYVIDDDDCRVLDITNGETVKIFELPLNDSIEKPSWGYLGILENKLIAGSDFVPFSKLTSSAPLDDEERKKLRPKDIRRYRDFQNYDNTASKKLVVMDRQSGNVLWELESRYGFIHNAVAAGKNTIYCLDKHPPAVEKSLARRGIEKPNDYRLLALDADTGQILWQANENVFGSWLGLSQEHNLLIQSTRPSRDMVRDEDGERMIVYNSQNGRLIWNREFQYNNPPIIHGEKIITDQAAYNIFSGNQINRTDPLTGEEIPWTYARAYGCNYNIASEHLLSFRSAAAGFYDLFSDGGTGNFGGFKSSCTANLIAADGVLNAPDYTRTCQCSYQNQTSLALVHMPELEYWTTNHWAWNGSPIQRVGINLNAAGDRIAEDGTLWLDFPSVGGESPDIPIGIDTTQITSFRRHSGKFTGSGEEWITASGLEGPFEMDITVANEHAQKSSYTINLYFAEIYDKKPSERMFDVYIQGEKVLENFDVLKEAGGANKSLVKSIKGVKVQNKINIKCTPCEKTLNSIPILSGIKIVKDI